MDYDVFTFVMDWVKDDTFIEVYDVDKEQVIWKGWSQNLPYNFTQTVESISTNGQYLVINCSEEE